MFSSMLKMSVPFVLACTIASASILLTNKVKNSNFWSAYMEQNFEFTYAADKKGQIKDRTTHVFEKYMTRDYTLKKADLFLLSCEMCFFFFVSSQNVLLTLDRWSFRLTLSKRYSWTIWCMTMAISR